MKTGISYVVDLAISNYEESVAKRIETQVAAYIANVVVDQTREFGGQLDAALQDLTDATVNDIEAAYNYEMHTKLLDVVVTLTVDNKFDKVEQKQGV